MDFRFEDLRCKIDPQSGTQADAAAVVTAAAERATSRERRHVVGTAARRAQPAVRIAA